MRNLFLGILIGLIIGVVVVGYYAVFHDRNTEDPNEEQLLQTEQQNFQRKLDSMNACVSLQDSVISMHRSKIDSLKVVIVKLKTKKIKQHAENNNLSDNDAVLLLRDNIRAAGY